MVKWLSLKYNISKQSLYDIQQITRKADIKLAFYSVNQTNQFSSLH